MRHRTIVLAGLAVLALACAAPAWAQEPDQEGCKDHPLLSRMKNFYISGCESNYDQVEFQMPESQTKTVEGQKTKISYNLQDGITLPSYFQIRKNYGNAVKSLGGSVLYDEDRYLTATVTKGGKEIWIGVEAYNDGGKYDLTIVEIGDMAQEVTAGEMLNALNRDGFIALYINFDTGKSDIKPEAEGTIGQIAALLKENPDLKASIEGHTDNVGTAAANKTLSDARAKSVMAAVVAKGVDASRLSAIGWGQEKPVADNRSEDGRAKNRRVEIVKK